MGNSDCTTTRRHEGTTARRYDCTTARRHDCTKVPLHDCTKARRHDVPSFLHFLSPCLHFSSPCPHFSSPCPHFSPSPCLHFHPLVPISPHPLVLIPHPLVINQSHQSHQSHQSLKNELLFHHRRRHRNICLTFLQFIHYNRTAEKACNPFCTPISDYRDNSGYNSNNFYDYRIFEIGVHAAWVSGLFVSGRNAD